LIGVDRPAASRVHQHHAPDGDERHTTLQGQSPSCVSENERRKLAARAEDVSHVSRSGITVVYIDDENRVSDVVERLQAFGYTYPADRLMLS
jgi:hypothetical protein